MNATVPEEPDVKARKHFKAKVCLVGNPAVGKTSLVRRYVMNSFDDRYLTTVGTKVSKKPVRVVDPSAELDADVDLMIWDIMGQPGFREMLKDAYFFDAKGVLAVADLTRKDTLEDLKNWIRAVEGVTGKVPIVVAINKADLTAEAGYSTAEAVQAAEVLGADVFLTSAKTGSNVEEAFRRLGARVLRHAVRGNGNHE
ncbi:MAG TPA: GTP-binding protein [Thermoplasmata archaeon]|nr:GTP-binding protein [Thermoplasmata archaeon]